MNVISRVLFALFALSLVLVLTPDAASAYGGPGSVLSGIGTVLAVIAAVVASLFGFIWFPLKRLVRSLRGNDEDSTSPAASTPSDQ
jgi:O-antigen ligase